jgi:poly-gamma-glutamate synthesis protein (capsule biosynthesis protein)
MLSVMAIFAFAKPVSAPENKEQENGFFQKLIKKTKGEGSEKNNIHPSLSISEETEIEIIFGGDIMLSRQVNTKMEKYHDYAWPVLKIASTTLKADIAIANLESPFLKDASYEVLSGSFSFKANPEAISSINTAGFDVLSLANNHTLNQGKKGIIDTIDILKDNNIAFCGAGLDEEGARQAAIVEKKGIKFAFLCYAYPDDASTTQNERAGIVNMDEEKMANDIKQNKNLADVIIVIMHAGTEYVTEPNWQQKDFARAAIDAGADIVVGHHPHWPQSFEFYQEKPIIYSLGNLIFDQMWSNETRQGLFLKITWQKGIKELKFIPIKIYDYGQPRLMEDEVEINALFKKIGAPSDGLIFKRNEQK